MSRERLTIPLVYVGDVVPRGARNPREACFRTETAVEIRTDVTQGLRHLAGWERT